MYKKIQLFIQNFFLIKKIISVQKYNSFEFNSIIKQSKIRVNGKDNEIKIADGNFKRVRIGIDGNSNKVLIDKDVYIRNLTIIIQGNNHTLFIGSKTEIGGANIVCCGQNTTIKIGENCLIASDINIKSCDGHSIYHDNRVINHSKDIFIRNHVWIGQSVSILKGVTIEENTIIGMHSLVTAGKFESNVVLGGSPARVLKNNVTWGKESTL